ncbi:hypothetical protein AB0I53_04440 [Saccharopolyspora sp. NPDC050389]
MIGTVVAAIWLLVIFLLIDGQPFAAAIGKMISAATHALICGPPAARSHC